MAGSPTPARHSRPQRVGTSSESNVPEAITYERHSGVARASLPAGYRRRESEKTVLHTIVRDHLESFLEQAALSDGDGYPRFVESEFRRYLDCGLLCHGFARLRCPQCGFERLVAFSCKGKLCPSCLNRRAADTAAWLADHLLPEAGYRQWVLTFPFDLRFRLAADRPLMNTFLRVFLRTLFTWQRKRGRALGIADGQTGAVTFVRRFGGALNLNPHLHSIVPDGLFVADSVDGGTSGGRLRFEPLPPPTTTDVEELTEKIARRLMERLAAAWEAEGNSYLDPELARLCDAFFFSRDPPVGKRDAPALPGMEEMGSRRKPLCAAVEGFSLHAAQSVVSEDREALERLLRYGLRAPFSQERLSLRDDGKVVYRLRRPWPNAQGATHLVLDPLDFLRRLASLVSFPYSHQVRYHGIFAGRSRLRRLLPPAPAQPECLDGEEPATTEASEARKAEQRQSPARRRRVPWAQLLMRLLHIDALACPRCSRPGRPVAMVVLAFLTDPEVVVKSLSHLGLPTCAPTLAPAGALASQELPLFSSPGQGDAVPDEGVDSVGAQDEEDGLSEASIVEIRPPP